MKLWVPIANEGWPAWTEADGSTIVQRSASEIDLVAFAFARPEEFADAPAGMEWVALTPTAGVLVAIEPGPRPTAEAEPGPSPGELAFKLGHDLGLDREDADAPEHFGPELVGEFEAGWAAGRREWDRRLEAMCGAAEYAEWSGSIAERDLYPAGATS